jgi:hypothetical protein
MSNFILENMCEFIKSGVRTDKGFKEFLLTIMFKALLEPCGAEVSSTHAYYHLRK